jgi:hypothetical protein
MSNDIKIINISLNKKNNFKDNKVEVHHENKVVVETHDNDSDNDNNNKVEIDYHDMEYAKTKLVDYIECDNINTIPIGTYCKIITYKDDKEYFNNGGILRKNEEDHCLFMRGTFFFKIKKKFYNDKNQLVYTSRFFYNPNTNNINGSSTTIIKLNDNKNNSLDESREYIKKYNMIYENELKIQRKSIDLLKKELLKLSKKLKFKS